MDADHRKRWSTPREFHLRLDFVTRFRGHDPRNACHDFLVLLSLLQIVGGLQTHPYFRRTANQAGHLQAHDG
jgi:hypothetical protein